MFYVYYTNDCITIIFSIKHMKILIFNSFISASPSPPTDFTVSDITSKSVMLHWCPPENNGGSEITGTYYEKSERLKFK